MSCNKSQMQRNSLKQRGIGQPYFNSAEVVCANEVGEFSTKPLPANFNAVLQLLITASLFF